MAQPTLPVPADRYRPSWFGAMAEWLDRPEHFQGLARRRAAAFVVDWMILGPICWVAWFVLATLTVLSFGLLSPMMAILGIVPVAYHTLLIGGRRGATFGMRLFDVEMRSWTGGRPDYLQALLATIVFYVTIGATWGLVLLIGVFNRRRRLAHDMLCGLVAVRSSRIGDAALIAPRQAR